MGGSAGVNAEAVTGAIGESSTSFTPSGRSEASGYYDAQRREFWLFGGAGQNGSFVELPHNDVWIYQLDTGAWTWYGGGRVRTPGTPPGRRQGLAWADPINRELFVFGGRQPERTIKPCKLISLQLGLIVVPSRCSVL